MNVWKSCTCEQRFCRINYKYERCKHTKTKSCYKNISCWFICSSILSFFLLRGDLKFNLMFFIQLIWWIRACQIFKKFDQTNVSNFAVYLIKFFCTLPPPILRFFRKRPHQNWCLPWGTPHLKMKPSPIWKTTPPPLPIETWNTLPWNDS